MSEIGIRELQQNASAVVAEATAGRTVTITRRGRPVALLTPLPPSRLDALIEQGRATPPRRPLSQLPPPGPGPDLSADLAAMRESER